MENELRNQIVKALMQSQGNNAAIPGGINPQKGQNVGDMVSDVPTNSHNNRPNIPLNSQEGLAIPPELQAEFDRIKQQFGDQFSDDQIIGYLQAQQAQGQGQLPNSY